MLTRHEDVIVAMLICTEISLAITYHVVNGRLDLVNLFPVKLDLKPFIDAWGNAARFQIYAPNGSFNFCGVDVAPSAAGTIQTNDVYTTTGDPLYAADLTEVEYEGVDITPSDYLGNNNEPGVLAFESLVAGRQLTLAVFFGDVMVLQFPLPAHFSSVRDMYRWYNGRLNCGGSYTDLDSTGVPSNLPDSETNGKDVFFIHGFNVSEADARNWANQVFKRLWLSGMRARFHGIAWYGDYNLGGAMFNGMHYHQDVYHALKTAHPFKVYVESVQSATSSRIVMAHSLGNMLASEALRQGLQVGKYFMLDAAVASEAVDGSFQDANAAVRAKYVPSDWNGYTNMCWAANWHRWFQSDATDARGKMGWPDYFSTALGNAGTAYNYYSTGDPVFFEDSAVPDVAAGLFHWLTLSWSWPFIDLNITAEANSWQKQETLKGVDPIFGTLHGGWGFRCWEETTNGVTEFVSYSAAEANSLVESGAVITNPVFSVDGTQLNNCNATQDDIYLSLAKHVPAISSPVGGSSALSRNNFNLNDISEVGRPNGWGRNDNVFNESWLHSDMKDMSFFHVYRLYEQLITKGDLQ